MGPELSVADLLIFLLLLSGQALLVTAPGWLVLGLAAGAGRAARGPGRAWPAAVAAALVGVLACGLCYSLVIEQLPLGGGISAGVLTGWAACWALALVVRPRPVVPGHRVRRAPYSGADRGWGR